MTTLRLSQLRLAYRDKTVLGPLDACLAQGRLHIVAGPNGAGKSSLLRHLAGILPEQSGEVLFGDQPLASLGRFEKARRIAYLAQERDLVWPLGARDLVMLGRHPHGASLETATKTDWQAVEEAMQATDSLSFADRPVTELSGGERARVLLARVLATGAEWLLLDEPVAGLDPRQQFLVMDLLKNQIRQGRSVLLVLHDLTLTARFADEILLLDKGLLGAQGPVEQVLTSQRLAAVFGIETVLSRGADAYNLQIHGVMPCNFR